jgi:hypothetical protein
MVIIPLQPVPSQVLTVALGAQRVGIAVYQRSTYDVTTIYPMVMQASDTGAVLTLDNGAALSLDSGALLTLDGAGVILSSPVATITHVVSPQMFMDLAVGDVSILNGAPCLEGVGIVRDAYLGFQGELVFLDTQGSADPYYDGLGSRWVLGWTGA